ncbi:MAG: hypothetical protein DRN20_00175 [Thermoplasmata archaeon]|nr:MAG: hypothetical protein DRN20_00175 [Thermoplasmata archaeon]
MTGEIVKVNDITKRFGHVVALDHVTVSFCEGITGLLGPNGAGKTTLVKIIMGIILPDSGEAYVLGNNVERDPEVRAIIGYVPEQDCLIEEMNAVEFLYHMAIISGVPRKDAMERVHIVLHYLGVGDERYRAISTYSAGMKQKIKIAQALVHDPQIIIMDEPTTGLDPQGREEVLALIYDLWKSYRKSIILSTHLLPDVERICSHVVMMSGGRVIEAGPIEGMLRGLDGYVVRVGGSGEDVEKFAEVFRDKNSLISRDDNVFVVRSEPSDILRAAAETGVQVRYLGRRRESLEEKFVCALAGDEYGD